MKFLEWVERNKEFTAGMTIVMAIFLLFVFAMLIGVMTR